MYGGHLSVAQVELGADADLGQVASMHTAADEAEPARQGEETVFVGDVVDEGEPVSPVDVVAGETDEVLVPRHVPQVQTHEDTVDVEDTGVVVHAHCRRIHVAERPLQEVQQMGLEAAMNARTGRIKATGHARTWQNKTAVHARTVLDRAKLHKRTGQNKPELYTRTGQNKTAVHARLEGNKTAVHAQLE